MLEQDASVIKVLVGIN